MPVRKIPMRMCLGCGEMKPKRELIRVVRQKDGTIQTDSTGKLAGRGAYLCPQPECFRKARKAHRLEKTFACSIPESIYDALEKSVTEAGHREGSA